MPRQGHKGTVPVFIDRKQSCHSWIFFPIISLKCCNQLDHLCCCLNWLLGKQRTLILLFSHFCLLLRVLCCAWSLSRVQLFVTPWTIAYQAPLSMGFSRQEYWSGLPFPSPGDLPDPGIEPRSPALQADVRVNLITRLELTPSVQGLC